MADWKIEKVRLGELRGFYKNTKFANGSVMPISAPRVESYISNPNGSPEDVVLYYLLVNNEVIAFRTLFADVVKTFAGDVKFGWCSGTWVHPKYRRKGLSGLLLKEAYADWNKRLMFTNYAPESEKGNLKSGIFTKLAERNGSRFYLNANYKTLLMRKANNMLIRNFVGLFGVLIQTYSCFKLKLYRPHNFSNYKIEEKLSYEDSFFDSEDLKELAFNRDKKVYRWIFNYPWITTTEENGFIYPFSLYRKSFQYYFISLQKDESHIAKMILSESEGRVKLLYASSKSEEGKGLLMRYLSDWCANRKIETLTVLDSEWCGIIKNVKNPFVWEKRFSMHIFTTFSVKNKEKLKIHDWEGDCVFT
ncbi:MAG: hypothetical protein PF436_05350 [Prolixibacteraceae bacterium]|jgi:GNAT superfamily N-acetyltransferase|nr:hypothetical protein [Prolixibacteraceae bacterium]